MHKQDLELIAEYVQKGIQSSKHEVSSLHREIRDDIKEIKQIMDKFDDRLDKLENRLDDQEKIQKELEPTFRAIRNLTWTGKVGVAFFVAIGAFVGALVTIENYIKGH